MAERGEDEEEEILSSTSRKSSAVSVSGLESAMKESPPIASSPPSPTLPKKSPVDDEN